MKPLTELRNIDKAKLLHHLFPAEMPGVLRFFKGMAATIVEHEQENRSRWPEDSMVGFDLWLQLAKDAEKVLNRYDRQLEKSANLFADQLFDGYGALFAIHCLLLYTTQSILPHTKLVKAVDLLFNA